MKEGTRDLIVSFAGIIISICAGIWTIFNYNIEERKIDIKAVFEITQQLEEIKRVSAEIQYDKIKIGEKIYKLYSEIQLKYYQIKRPFFINQNDWRSEWQEFYQNVQNAYVHSLNDKIKQKINSNWENILQKKGITLLEDIK